KALRLGVRNGYRAGMIRGLLKLGQAWGVAIPVDSSYVCGRVTGKGKNVSKSLARFVDTRIGQPYAPASFAQTLLAAPSVVRPSRKTAQPVQEKTMNRVDTWKLLGVIAATAWSLWLLYPSYHYYTMTPAQRAALPAHETADLRRKAIHLGLDLQGGMHLVLEVDRSRLNVAEAKDATERAMEIIRNRVDQFGVAEPLIQREGEDRIVVQLPGLTDRQRAIELIGKTALLEFKLLRTPDEVKNLFERMDSYLAHRGI